MITKEEAERGMKEFDMAWQEFFKDKPEPKNDDEEKKEQEEFYHWYNYVRKQSDTGKTPAEMYKEIYGEDPRNIFDEKKPSRFMNFEWDEDYNEDDFDEENIYEFNEIADHMFKNGVWQNSKGEMKEMSKRDSSRHMFKLGFFMCSKYMNERMKNIAKELEAMPEEEIENMIKNFKENKNDLEKNKKEKSSDGK